MDVKGRIEAALDAAVSRAGKEGAPPKLAEALRYAVFPGGARVRPQLCLAVARACGDDAPSLATASAISIELLHCASLVHDDLPCFDDADTRRSKPSVHRMFGEPLAVLAGDALIVMAFEALARSGTARPERLPGLVLTMSRAAGSPAGLVAGQAWESEDTPDLGDYHKAKTGSLFVAATTSGALASGMDPAPWFALGSLLGEAYQVADDLRDVALSGEELGKPCRQDETLLRPSAVASMGLQGALSHFKELLEAAVESVPDCEGHDALRELVVLQSKRLVPKDLAQTAA